jgi:hypothetical protein
MKCLRYNDDMISRKNTQTGMVSGPMVAIIGLAALVLVLGAVSIWAIVNYNEQKTDVDGRVSVAVAEGKNVQADEDEKKFLEREKEPLAKFVGPDDYGRLTFSYPKTWSAYVEKDASSGGEYTAYFYPQAVPPVSEDTQQFALRITIEQRDYDQVVQSYDGLVKKGDLKQSTTSSQGNQGTRLEGNFSKNIRGAGVIYKSRDKTITVRTDAFTFKPDFDKLVQTIEFNV